MLPFIFKDFFKYQYEKICHRKIYSFNIAKILMWYYLLTHKMHIYKIGQPYKNSPHSSVAPLGVNDGHITPHSHTGDWH